MVDVMFNTADNTMITVMARYYSMIFFILSVIYILSKIRVEFVTN